MRKKLREMRKTWAETKQVKETIVGAEEIARVVASMTGIPVSEVEEEETEKLLRLEDELRKRIVGQDEAVEAVCKAVRRNRAGLRDPRRPIGSFVFLGPTGVGKTELARALSETLFESEEALVRIDMSEYMEKFAVSRLIGAPPGYVGYDEGGQLTEKVRRKPYSVILLDEIEKAHPDVFNILLQVMDDGALTDNYGRRVDFRNTVLIMTSNVGTGEAKAGKSLGFSQDTPDSAFTNIKGKLMDRVKQTFNPEFLNRLDETIVFRPLGREEMESIVTIMLTEFVTRLKSFDLKIEFTKESKDFLMERGFDPSLGARPLRRAIQRYLEDPLSELLLKKGLRKDAEIHVTLKEGGLDFDVVAKAK
jgi:ATP-dependent Clp protease ATP-binding subunit ClpC